MLCLSDGNYTSTIRSRNSFFISYNAILGPICRGTQIPYSIHLKEVDPRS
jgi:hypothetical protein